MGRHPADRRIPEGPAQAVHRVGDRRLEQESDAEPAPLRRRSAGQCARRTQVAAELVPGTARSLRQGRHVEASRVSAAPALDCVIVTEDRELFDIIRREEERQNTTLQLIASENFTSRAVMAATGSVLTNKYSEGYPGKRYYGGNYVIDEVEELARRRACQLFGAEHANVQPHAGANANLAAYLAVLDHGDTVLGMRLDQGGHLTHGSPVNISGRFYRFVSYGVTDSDERLDLDQLASLAAGAPARS